MGNSLLFGKREEPLESEHKLGHLPAWTWGCSREVHIWCAPLIIAKHQDNWRDIYLSVDEATRADQFYSSISRNHFILGRMMTRMILASLRELCADHVDISLDPQGKPRLNFGHHTGLCFNISHSGDYVLIAFALHREVGVDVELAQRRVDIAELSQHLYAPDEATLLHSLPPFAQACEFFRSWCRKEALVKGLGCGLSVPMTEFNLAPTDLANSRFWRVASASTNVDFWRVYDIRVDHRHLAALAVEGPVSAINVWKLTKNVGKYADERLNFDCEVQFKIHANCGDAATCSINHAKFDGGSNS
jgi:4'-phosphopantetheinyl transferase